MLDFRFRPLARFAAAAVLLSVAEIVATPAANGQTAETTWRGVDRVIAFADVHGA